jgi:heat shock protein HslJ
MNTKVKKAAIQILLFVLIPAAFSYAKGTAEVNSISFSEVQGKIWNLTEVINGSTAISVDRTDVPIDIYTIRFDPKLLVGAGAVNFFSAHYTVGDNNLFSIGRLASTRVGNLYEMKDFTEYEYFQHLERVSRWGLHDGKLELHTCGENGDEVILIFA